MIEIKIEGTWAEVKIKESNKTETKIIDISDLHTVFKDNVDYDSGDLGLFGQGAFGVKRIIGRGDKQWVLVHAIDPCINVRYSNGKIFENVYHPSLLLACKLIKQSKGYKLDINASFLMACQHMLMTENDQMYHYPFPNVWSEGMGKICWGSIELPLLESTSQAIGILQMFLGATVNNDLYRPERLRTTDDKYKVSDSQSLFISLSKQYKNLKHFPYDEIKMTPKTTYKEVVQWCKQQL